MPVNSIWWQGCHAKSALDWFQLFSPCMITNNQQYRKTVEMLKHRKLWYHGAHVWIWSTWSTHSLFSWKTYSVLRRRPSNLRQSDLFWENPTVKALEGVLQNSQEMHFDSQCQQSSQSGKWPYYHFIRQGPRLNWPCGESIAIHFSHSPITLLVIITSVYSCFLHISALFWFGLLSNPALGVWHKHRLLASGEISSTQSLKIWFKIDISTVIIHSTFQLTWNSSPRCAPFRFGSMSRYGKVTVSLFSCMHACPTEERLWIGYRLNNGIYNTDSPWPHRHRSFHSQSFPR